MHQTCRSCPLKAIPALCGLLILLVGCSTTGPTPLPRFATSTPIPTATSIPTVTPLALDTLAPAPTLPSALFGIPASGSQGSTSTAPVSPGAGTAPLATISPQTAAPALPATSATPSPSPLPTSRLTGPVQGLVPSQQGLWAMRPDGSQPSLLTNDPVDAVAASPIGGMAAYITHAPAGGSFYTRPFGYLLKLITLSNDNTYPVASLDPPGISASSPSQVLDSAAQSLVALNHGALAWSPTGSTLAFTSSQGSAQGQPSSSDVYLYSPNNGQIRRVSQLNLPDGPAHAYALEWSPGGTLLFFAVAYSFGATPDKALTAGAWVAGLNGTLTQVAQANQSSGEVLDAWLPNSQILLHSNNPGCGESNLRTVSYQTGQATDLWPGCYSDMLYDKLRAEVLISVSQSAANPGSNNPQGLYRISLYQPQPSAISDMGFEKLFAGDYKASWYGYSPGEGLLATQRDGSTAPIFTGDSYDGSNGALLKPLMRLPDGVTWLWTGEGNRLFSAHPGQPPQVLFDLPVQNLNPSPTVPGLYFFFSPGDNGLRLYGVRARDWQPFLVDTRMQDPNGLAWAR